MTLRRIEGRLQESIIELKKACEGSNKPNYINNLGLSYFEADQMADAEHYFQLAIAEQTKIFEKDQSPEVRENLSFYYKNKGLAMYHQGKMDQAKESFETAIRLHDRNADNYFNLGNVFLSNEKPDFKQAHLNFDRALELEPGNSKLYHAKGLAY